MSFYESLDLGALLQTIEDLADEICDSVLFCPVCSERVTTPSEAEPIKEITELMASRKAFQEVMNRHD